MKLLEHGMDAQLRSNGGKLFTWIVVGCLTASPSSYASSSAASAPSPAPAELAGTSWKITDFSAPPAEFGNNPDSEAEADDAAETRKGMIGVAIDFSTSGANGRCRWSSVAVANAGNPSNLDGLDDATFPSDCGTVRPFKKIYLLKMTGCAPGDSGELSDIGFLDDSTAVAYESPLWLCLKKSSDAKASPVSGEGGSDADCTMNPKGLVSILDSASPAIKQYLGTKKDSSSIRESARLKDGVGVTFVNGGCDHLAYSLTFENFPRPKTMDKAGWLALALGLLRETPAKPPAIEKKTLLDALTRGKGSSDALEGGILNLPCGDAACALDIRDKGKLTVGYDFAL
jgi:hypothetical protein